MEETLEKRVLVIDDEPGNVEALLDYFDQNGVKYDYAFSLDSAVEYLQYAENKSKRYDLVISDNHFCYDDFSERVSNFDGIDLVNILTGHDDLTDAHLAMAVACFGEDYAGMVDHYGGRVIMFSGSAASDSEYNPDLFRGLIIVSKRPDEDACCEEEVVAVMEEVYGFKFGRNSDCIRDYKFSYGLGDGVSDDREDDCEIQVMDLMGSDYFNPDRCDPVFVELY